MTNCNMIFDEDIRLQKMQSPEEIIVCGNSQDNFYESTSVKEIEKSLCSFCGKEINADNLGNLEKGICSICNSGNKKKQPHKCHICGKVLSGIYNLRRHIQKHSGEKPFECTICSKRFTEKGSLKKHMLIHSEDSPFRCSICDRKFTQLGHLKAHTLLHSGERPFLCSQCG